MGKQLTKEDVLNAKDITYINKTIYVEPREGNEVYGISRRSKEWFLEENYWDYYDSELMHGCMSKISAHNALKMIYYWGKYPFEEQNAKLDKAICFAVEHHAGQLRKGTVVPYITHPLEVMSILMRMNGSIELQIAGLLHDTVEDTDVTIEEIRSTFGERVAALVSSHTEDKEKTWKERKQHTIDSLATADRDTKLLILADKVSNLRSMLSDYAEVGEALWTRFNATKEVQSWYNSELQDALYDLQFDGDARLVYWEMVGLYKDLFVEFYADYENETLYQCACGEGTYRFYTDDGTWESYEGAIPECAVCLPRLQAEALEDWWREAHYEPSLDGNERIDEAIGEYRLYDTDENMMAVLQTILDRILENGSLIFPAEPVTIPGEEREDVYGIKTVRWHTVEEAVACFTCFGEVRKGPETEIKLFSIEKVLESICENEEMEGLVINPWGKGFYIPREMLQLILDCKKQRAGEACEEAEI